jgi:hypothetical protein
MHFISAQAVSSTPSRQSRESLIKQPEIQTTCGHEEDALALQRSRITKACYIEIVEARSPGETESQWISGHDECTTLAAESKPGNVPCRN